MSSNPKGIAVDKILDGKLIGGVTEFVAEVKGVFKQEGVIAPSNWSQTAVNIMAQKYFRKAGVPNRTVRVPEQNVPEELWRSVPDPDPATTFGSEFTVGQVMHRLSGAWAYWGWKEGIFQDSTSAVNFKSQVYIMLMSQMLAPNSPQFFNQGLWWAYGIEGEKANQFYVDPADNKVKQSENSYTRSQNSACFILPVEDSLTGLDGITDTIRREADVFKFGSGSGTNVSELRGMNEPLSGGGKSSGLISFLRVLDRNAGAIKSGGTCLAPTTPVYTDNGPVEVHKLAELESFQCLSFDPATRAYVYKKAKAFVGGCKTLYKVNVSDPVSDERASFLMSFDHPVRLDNGNYKIASELEVDDVLTGCVTDLHNWETSQPIYQDIVVQNVEISSTLTVYDVEIDCPTTDATAPESGHNFVVWSGLHKIGMGIAVHNTRRAAVMRCLDDDHPDLMEFIDWKLHEENKVAALAYGSEIIKSHIEAIHAAAGNDKKIENAAAKAVEAGVPAGLVHRVVNDVKMNVNTDFKVFDVGWTSEAYETVSGQNSNNSVRLTDEFMEAVEKNLPWPLFERTELRKAAAAGREPVPCKTLKAREIWDRIAYTAWACADPGLHFDTTIQEWHTGANTDRIKASNPCQPGFATVLTPEGIRTFDEIDVGSVIWDGTAWTKVTHKWATGEKPVFRFRTSAGVFIGTKCHKVFQNGERVEAGEAESIDVCQGPSHVIAPSESTEHVTQAVIDGWVFGDGLLKVSNGGKNSYPLLCVGEDDAWILDDNRFKPFVTYEAFDKKYHLVKTTISEDVLKTNLPERRVPNSYLQGTPQQVIEFLRGLYSANGSVCGNRVTLKSTCLELIVEVQTMLSSLGISSYYTTNAPQEITWGNGKTYTSKKSYDLNITRDRKKFRELIGFLHEGKISRLNVACNATARNWSKSTYEVVETESLGVMPVYDITVESFGHRYWTGGLLVSNCSEFHYIDDSSCNLLSINLGKFYQRGFFNSDLFYYVCNISTMILEISVYCGQFPSPSIARVTHDHRTLGLGYANLGKLLMTMGLPYDSEEGRYVASCITAAMHSKALYTSMLLARAVGPYKAFAENREHVIRVMDNHRAAIRELESGNKGNYRELTIHPSLPNVNQVSEPIADKFGTLLRAADNYMNLAINGARTYGIRNAQVTVIAPTGCLVAGSMVVSSSGLRRIESFGDPNGEQWQPLTKTEVLTDEGPKPATKFYINGKAAVWKVTTMAGYVLTGTAKHQVRVMEGAEWVWKELGKLEPGMRVPISTGKFVGSPRTVTLPTAPSLDPYGTVESGFLPTESMTEPLAFITGVLAVKGRVTRLGLSFPNIKGEVADKLVKALSESMSATSVRTDNSVTVEAIGLSQWVLGAGLVTLPDPADRAGRVPDPRIPDVILATNDPKIYASYLSGVYAATGLGTALSSDSMSFLNEVRAMLLMFGVVVIDSPVAPTYPNRIAPFGPRSTALLEQVISGSNLPPTPKVSFYVDEIATTKELPEESTYDLEVPEKVTYVANGYFSHNTISFVMDCDTTGCEPDFALVKYKTLAGGGSMVIVNGAVKEALQNLKYQEEEIEDILSYILSKGTIEGAPHLKVEHLPVFDCAVATRPGGREISPEGHIDMLGAIQPFISGSISKTVNVGADTTVEQVKALHLRSYLKGNKCVAIFRNNCKLSQPLTIKYESETEKKPNAVVELTVANDQPSVGVQSDNLSKYDLQPSPEESLRYVPGPTDPREQSVRERLPYKRNGYTQQMKIGGQTLYLRTGEYDNGRLGEIFITMSRDGATLRGMTNAFAVAVSLGLQYGVPLEEFVNAFTFTRFEPNGIVQEHDRIGMATSIIDLIFRDLAISYLGRQDLAHKHPAIEPEFGPADREMPAPVVETKTDSQSVMTGELCTTCGSSKLKRAGACKVCENCGTTGGCG